MYAIYAGLEPEGFIELFPYWVVQEDITEAQLDVCYCFIRVVTQKNQPTSFYGVDFFTRSDTLFVHY